MKNKISSYTFIIVFLSLISFYDNASAQNHSSLKISNPVAEDGADPWVILFEGKYYYCYSDNEAIYVNCSSYLIEAVQMNGQLIWKPEPLKNYSKEIWAPELHNINGKWFVYFAADDGDNKNHRMYVLESKTADPSGEYFLRGKIFDSSDKWAIDGTVFNYNEKYYFIWSGWEGDVNVQQNLYIAEMENPWTIKSARVKISKPEYDWEKIGQPYVNEGPEILRNGELIFIIYSASGSWTDNYCLGQLKLTGTDPMNPNSWSKNEMPVFTGTDEVFSPGHASFTKSIDGKEDWIVYHTAKHKGAGWDRNVRIQKFNWKENGEPDFGKPLSDKIEFNPPSKSKTSGLCEGCFHGNMNER
jgi:GH43 family beta-xylosidase